MVSFVSQKGLGDLDTYQGDPSHPSHKQLLDVESYPTIESDMVCFMLCLSILYMTSVYGDGISFAYGPLPY